MPTSLFDSSKLSRTQKFELQKKYPKATNIFSYQEELDRFGSPANQSGNVIYGPRSKNQRGQRFGEAPTPRTGPIVAGEMIPSEAAPFGYKDGQPIISLLPQSEMIRRQQEALAKKELTEYDPGYMSNKIGMPLKMGTPLGEASFKIRRAFDMGEISASQARSLADRVMAYYDDKTQKGLFSKITGTGGAETSMEQPAPKPRRRSRAVDSDFNRPNTTVTHSYVAPTLQ